MLFSYNPIYLPKILQIGTKANKSMRQFISAVKGYQLSILYNFKVLYDAIAK